MRTASSGRRPRGSAPQRDGEKHSRGVLRPKCSAKPTVSPSQSRCPAVQHRVTSHRNRAPKPVDRCGRCAADIPQWALCEPDHFCSAAISRNGPRLCKKGLVSAPCAEHRGHSRAETQFLLESILRAPGTLPGAPAGIDLNAQHPSAQVARAFSSTATPMIAITRLML